MSAILFTLVCVVVVIVASLIAVRLPARSSRSTAVEPEAVVDTDDELDVADDADAEEADADEAEVDADEAVADGSKPKA